MSIDEARKALIMETLDNEPAVIGAGCAPAFKPGSWTDIPTVDDLERFYLSRLPAIREAAQAHGYAIGLHGSCRRDLDLIAAPWRDDAADADTLAHAVAQAACGIDRAGTYDWELKPLGRLATSIPICWPAWHGQAGAGHIDLSVMPGIKLGKCRGIADSRCGYLGHCTTICNKCGREHDGKLPVVGFPG